MLPTPAPTSRMRRGCSGVARGRAADSRCQTCQFSERGLDLSYETVRSWVLKFGPIIVRRLRRSRPRPSNRWHLDEMVVRIVGKHMYLWRAVDLEGEVLEILVQRRRDKCAAVKLMCKLLRKHGFAPKTVTTDKLRSYGAAFQHLG